MYSITYPFDGLIQVTSVISKRSPWCCFFGEHDIIFPPVASQNNMEEVYKNTIHFRFLHKRNHHEREDVLFFLWNHFRFISSRLLSGIFWNSGITLLFPAYTATVAEYLVWNT